MSEWSQIMDFLSFCQPCTQHGNPLILLIQELRRSMVSGLMNWPKRKTDYMLVSSKSFALQERHRLCSPKAGFQIPHRHAEYQSGGKQ